MNEAVRLQSTDLVVERPFTHPDHNIIDRAILRTMIDDFYRQLLAQAESQTTPIYYCYPTEAAYHKRIIITNPARAMDAQPLALVGFFGQKQAHVETAVETEMANIGSKLVARFARFPAIVGYYTWLLADERNYANLVLLDHTDAISTWRVDPVHEYATSQLSPNVYAYVRIYNGMLPAAAWQNTRRLQLNCVKYWDYRTQPVWHAVRTLE